MSGGEPHAKYVRDQTCNLQTKLHILLLSIVMVPSRIQKHTTIFVIISDVIKFPQNSDLVVAFLSNMFII